MSLQDEIDKRSKEIHTDGYPMSIGEILSLYKDGELDIHPEFQRYFRWSILQKTKLVESILLGIPIPSIFVSQREDGVWDVIDGLQRISTIFQFVGVLKDSEGKLEKPIKLVKTEYLPSLEGKVWENEPDEINSLTPSQRMAFKRSKIDIKIVKKESDPNTKYELFQRLNTLGTKLSDQEVRNCLLIMYDKSFYNWLKSLSRNSDFKSAIDLSEGYIDQQYDVELVLRFFIFKNVPVSNIRGVEDLGEFITNQMIEFSQSPKFNREKEADIFKKTFQLLNENSGSETFKRYNTSKKAFMGMFLISAFETIAIGLGSNIESWLNPKIAKNVRANLLRKIRSLATNSVYQETSGSGGNAKSRIPVLVPLGKGLFKV